MSTAPKDFHGHLDVCERCRTQPFNLCVEGARLLKAAATEPLKKPPAGSYDNPSLSNAQGTGWLD